MNKIKAIIIDDEKDSREIIRLFLAEQFPSIEIVAEAHSVKSGLESILLEPPDLLFLDIRMADGNGFDILNQLAVVKFDIIFITTFEQFAIDAFKHHAFGFVLKPIDRKEFNLVVEKYLEKEKKAGNVKHLLNNLLTKLQPAQITLPTLTGFSVVSLDEITRLEADGGYTKLFLNNGKMVLTSKYLKEYEKVLPAETFCRIHHSHLINIQYMKEYIKGRGGQVVLMDGTTLSVSQNRKGGLLKFWY